jgi:hypothetical protein
MCSSSERFIPAEDSRSLVLWHNYPEGAALPHPIAVFTAVRKLFDDTSQSASENEIAPLSQGVFRLLRIIRISKPPLNPILHEIELGRVRLKNFRDNLIHLKSTLVDQLVPIHEVTIANELKKSGSFLRRSPD